MEENTTGLKAGTGLMADENYAQIENNLLEYDSIDWISEAAEFKDENINMFYETENEVLAEFTGDHHFVMYDDGEMLVDMNLEDGSTIFGPTYTPDETAKIFWETIGKVRVNNITETEKDLVMYKQLYADTNNILQEIRHNLGVPEGENIIEYTASPVSLIPEPTKRVAYYNLEDFGIPYDPTALTETFTCMSSNEKGKGSKVEVLPGGESLGAGLEDLEYFRDKLARATTSDEANKIKKQIELLEDSIVIYHEHRPSSFKTFDDAMKVID